MRALAFDFNLVKLFWLTEKNQRRGYNLQAVPSPAILCCDIGQSDGCNPMIPVRSQARARQGHSMHACMQITQPWRWSS